MSKTCVQVPIHANRECGEIATHVVSHKNLPDRPMCVRHASKFASFDFYVIVLIDHE